jgi:hypothetical protein
MVDVYKLTSTRDHSDSSTLFHVMEINSNGKLLRNSKPLQIHHNDIWIERGENYGSSYSLGASRDKSNALALLIFKYEENTQADETHGTHNQVTSIEPLDIYVSYSARSYFRNIFESIIIPHTDTVNTIWPSADRYSLSLTYLLTHLTTYSLTHSLTQGRLCHLCEDDVSHLVLHSRISNIRRKCQFIN